MQISIKLIASPTIVPVRGLNLSSLSYSKRKETVSIHAKYFVKLEKLLNHWRAQEHAIDSLDSHKHISKDPDLLHLPDKI